MKENWKKLVELKHNNPALAAGERGGEITWWEVPEDIVAFSREVKDNLVVVITNFGKEEFVRDFNYPGTFTNVFSGETIETRTPFSLAPGEYLVLTK